MAEFRYSKLQYRYTDEDVLYADTALIYSAVSVSMGMSALAKVDVTDSSGL